VTPFNDSIVNVVNTPAKSHESKSKTTTDQMASASLSLGFISVISTLLLSAFGGAVLGLLAIIFGVIGFGKIEMSGGEKTGKAQAVFGILFGILSIAIFIWFINYLAGQ
jgi:heme O synthase-like polyprenyltransferase